MLSQGEMMFSEGRVSLQRGLIGEQETTISLNTEI